MVFGGSPRAAPAAFMVMLFLGSLLLVSPDVEAASGSGQGGYVWVDEVAGQDFYSWDSVTTPLPISSTYTGQVDSYSPLGFQWKFAGGTYTSVYAGEDGLVGPAYRFTYYDSYYGWSMGRNPVSTTTPKSTTYYGLVDQSSFGFYDAPYRFIAPFYTDHTRCQAYAPNTITPAYTHGSPTTGATRKVISWEDWPMPSEQMDPEMTRAGYVSNGGIAQTTCKDFNSFQLKIFEGSDIYESHYDHAVNGILNGVAYTPCRDVVVGQQSYGSYYMDIDERLGQCTGGVLEYDDYAWRAWVNDVTDASTGEEVVDEGTANNPISIPVSNDPLYYGAAPTGPTSGTLAGFPAAGSTEYKAPGDVEYSPNFGFTGLDSFTFTVEDGYDPQQTGTVNIHVNARPDPQPDDVVIDWNTGYQVLDVLSNDVDDYWSDDCTATPSTVGGEACLDVVGAQVPRHGTATASGGKLYYKPDAGFYGNETFTYQVSDGRLSEWATVTVRVNSAPVAEDDGEILLDQGDIAFPVTHLLGNDTDAFWSSKRGPMNDTAPWLATAWDANGGTYAVNAEGDVLSYTPAPTFYGDDLITYRITDGRLTDTAQFPARVNAKPVAATDSVVLHERGAPVSVDVVANDVDPYWSETDGFVYGATFDLIEARNGNAGDAVLISDTEVEYTIVDDQFYGLDAVEYDITDGRIVTTGTLDVAVNAKPRPVTDFVPALPNGGTVDVVVTANDNDPYYPNPVPVTGTDLEVSSIGTATYGTVTAIGTDTVRYTATPGAYGIDKVPYTVTDNVVDAHGVRSMVEGTLDVTINAAPEANNDDLGAIKDSLANAFYPLANDRDRFLGNALEIVSVDATGSTGLVSWTPGDAAVYYDAPAVVGTDAFSYTITDGIDVATGTVTIAVRELDPIPRFVAQQAFEVDEGSLATIGTVHLSASDDNNVLADLHFEVLGSGAHGNLLIGGAIATVGQTFTPTDIANGDLSYRHDGSETLDDAISLRVHDNMGNARAGNFVVFVNPVNDPPVVNAVPVQEVEWSWNTQLPSAMLITDPDDMFSDLRITLDSEPALGRILDDGIHLTVGDETTFARFMNGLVVYKGFGVASGADSLDFTVTDRSGASATGTIEFLVLPRNEAPDVSVNKFEVGQGSGMVLSTNQIQATDDFDGPDGIRFVVETPSPYGLLLRDGQYLVAGGQFTMQDILDGRVSYAQVGPAAPYAPIGLRAWDSTLHEPGLLSVAVELPVYLLGMDQISDEVDRDADGVVDTMDNCPMDVNLEQADKDYDGLGDVCDPVDDSVAASGGGAGTTGTGTGTAGGVAGGTTTGTTTVVIDLDADGINDVDDLCPSVADGAQSDMDGDGIGDACDEDRDGDGVPQIWPGTVIEADNCPDTPNQMQQDRDLDGIGDNCDGDADAGLEGSGPTDRSGSLQETKARVANSGGAAMSPWAIGGMVALAVLLGAGIVVMTMRKARA